MTKRLRTICVGTVTRNRPVMLQALLASYAAMTIPADTRLHFVIVENNAIPTLGDIIDHFRTIVPNCTVQYEYEPRLGISFVRNRVLDIAMSNGCDLLTFADDDETVQPDWLVELLAERDACDLDIVGSPVRLSPITGISFWKQMIWDGLNDSMQKHEMVAAATRQNNQAQTIMIATNSWMANLDFLRTEGLRFDEALGLHGGEDWQLCREAKTAGAKTGWAPQAIVNETLSLERLTMLYQFKRNRDHSAVEIRKKLATRKVFTLLRLPGSFAARLLKLSIQLVVMPVKRGQSLVKIASYTGSMAGMLQVFNKRSTPHYKKTTGY